MANIEQIKAVITAATRDTEDVVTQVQGLCDRLDEAIVRIRTAAAGSSHPKADEAIRYLQQARDRLDEAGTLARGALDAAGTYKMII
ncbi:hypothetical protein [Longispora albida]|uniref:hypothetical protein n=1 Tax=Longispora albida TaxID=203523 RepID=UPI00036AA893|nr:hypothetical protein [Longispora albida]